MHIWEKQILPDWRMVHRNRSAEAVVAGCSDVDEGQDVVGNPLAPRRGDALAQLHLSLR